MERALTQRWLTVLGSFFALIAISVSARGVFLLGQALNQTAIPTETFQVHSGDIVELLPVHNLPSPVYSWILTQDRTFLEAGQDRVFRTRLIQPGTYILNAEITVSDRSQRIRRVFQIQVADQAPLPEENDSTFIVDLVRTEPGLEGEDENMSVILEQETQLLKLLPLQEGVGSLGIDLDVLNDDNSDNNPRNDVNNAGTFFYETGSPIFIWFADSLQEQEIVVHAQVAGGVLQEQPFRVLSSSFARSQGLVDLRVDFSAEATDALSYQFTPLFPDGTRPSIPVIYEWDFGDGQNSLEENPLHAYETFGSYPVGITVRNLNTGNKLGSRVREITIDAPPILPDEEGPSEVEKQQLLDQVEGEQEEEPTEEGGGSMMGIIFVLVLILAVLGGAGFGVMLLIRKIRARKADAVQEEAAKETPPQEGQEDTTKEEKPSVDVEKKESTEKESSQEKPQEASADSGEPDWLKDSGDTPADKTEPSAPEQKKNEEKKKDMPSALDSATGSVDTKVTPPPPAPPQTPTDKKPAEPKNPNMKPPTPPAKPAEQKPAAPTPPKSPAAPQQQKQTPPPPQPAAPTAPPPPKPPAAPATPPAPTAQTPAPSKPPEPPQQKTAASPTPPPTKPPAPTPPTPKPPTPPTPKPATPLAPPVAPAQQKPEPPKAPPPPKPPAPPQQKQTPPPPKPPQPQPEKKPAPPQPKTEQKKPEPPKSPPAPKKPASNAPKKNTTETQATPPPPMKKEQKEEKQESPDNQKEEDTKDDDETVAVIRAEGVEETQKKSEEKDDANPPPLAPPSREGKPSEPPKDSPKKEESKQDNPEKKEE